MAVKPRPARLAVLIDADNVPPAIADGLIAAIAKLGDASVRRVYGDFSRTQLKPWTERMGALGLVPYQAFANIPGKNATDIALAIDAMDLLHTGRFDGFCLVSSDSDFTRLAVRIREQGLDVFGFGELHTPASFVQACKSFTYVEKMMPKPPETVPAAKIIPITAGAPVETTKAKRKKVSQVTPADAAPPAVPPAPTVMPMPQILPVLMEVAEASANGQGWSRLDIVGAALLERVPGFSVKRYGFPRLSDLALASGAFEVKRAAQKGKHFLIRRRWRSAAAVFDDYDPPFNDNTPFDDLLQCDEELPFDAPRSLPRAEPEPVPMGWADDTPAAADEWA